LVGAGSRSASADLDRATIPEGVRFRGRCRCAEAHAVVIPNTDLDRAD
jgi:hypothetical protein